MFKGRGEGNVVYKCSIRLFGDSEILELEFQVIYLRKFIKGYFFRLDFMSHI